MEAGGGGRRRTTCGPFGDLSPDEVAGMVLVDSSHEDQVVGWSAVLTPSQLTTIKNGVAANPEGVDIDAS